MQSKTTLFRVYLFFITLLALSLIVFFTTKSNKTKAHEEIGKVVPLLEVMDFNIYVMDLQKVIAKSNGAKLMRFEDYDEAYDVFGSQLNNEQQKEEIFAPYVKFYDNVFHMPKGVSYARSDNLRLWSESGVYNMESKVFSGVGRFSLRQQSSIDLEGRDLTFDMADSHLVYGKGLSGYFDID